MTASSGPDTTSRGKLVLGDIVDLREYEREREACRDQIIALKAIRRIGVGPVVTLVFENRETIRFQIQEMVRAERMLTDAAVQTELDTYNPLIPEPGQLTATLFIELTSKEQMVEWLPKLVGIETSIWFEVGSGDDRIDIQCEVDPDHAAQLTREEITASVHYVSFRFPPEAVRVFASGPVALVVRHRAYDQRTELAQETIKSLLTDLLPAD